MLIQYLRRRKRHRNEKIAVLVAELRMGGFVIGWSMKDRRDSFDRDKGMAIAIGRLESRSETNIPHSIRVETLQFAKRCAKYFKTNMIWPQEDHFHD